VKAMNSIGSSAPSPAGVAGLLQSSASAPANVKASVAGGSATVSWSPPTQAGGGHLFEYVARAGSRACTTKQTTCTITGLAPGRSYQVSVVAVTTSGSTKPGVTTVTVPAPLPKPPQEVT
jgi:hypothetical protein